MPTEIQVECLNAYMFWIKKYDLHNVTLQTTIDNTPPEKYMLHTRTDYLHLNKMHGWPSTYILCQEHADLENMRTKYTELSGKHWKDASLSDVYNTLTQSVLLSMYEKGYIRIDGQTNMTAYIRLHKDEIYKLVEELMRNE